VRTPGLRHEPVDDAVELETIVEAVAHQFLDAGDVPGARSGRIRIVTGPLEVSRRSVLPSSASDFGSWVVSAFSIIACFDTARRPFVMSIVASQSGPVIALVTASVRPAGPRHHQDGRQPENAGFPDGHDEGPPRNGAPNLSVSGSGVQCLSMSRAAA